MFRSKLKTTVLGATIAVLALASSQLQAATAQADSTAIVNSADCTQNQLPANDDGSASPVALPFDVNFYGQTYSSVYVNNNGNVTFDAPLTTYTPFGLLATQTPIIAPFFADVDTRATGSDPVKYGFGTTTYDGHPALCVDWVNVGYYSSHADKLNSVQLLLVSHPESGAGAFDIVFNYGTVQWETGDASGGVNGFGGTSARAGFSAGTGEEGTSTELPGSGIPGSFLDNSTSGLANQSLGSGTAGRYVFPVRAGGIISDKYVALGDSYQSGEGAYDYDPRTDTSTNRCHRSDNAYPNLLVNDGTVRLSLDFRACSGATIADMLVPNSTTRPPYDDGIAQVDALGSDTRLVTVGIVGNDLDFAYTVRSCVKLNGEVLIPVLGGWVGSCASNLTDAVNEKIADLQSGQTRTNLAALYRLIKAKAPYARVVAVSYPQFFPKSGAQRSCSGIRTSDQVWMNSLVKRADAAIGTIARSAGFDFVNMAKVNQGHEQCTDDPAMNGIVIDNLVANESFHPNAYGHRLMAAAISDKLDEVVQPTFSILPQETNTEIFTVEGKHFSVNVAWPGSDVENTLISPSGRTYSRSDHTGADHGNGPTYEYFDIADPEPGQWTLRSFGANVATNGEPVTVETNDETALNQLPSAVISQSGSGTTFAFDATASTDPDGTITDYLWDFGDGTTGTGPTVTHTYQSAGQYRATLVTTDNSGDQGFGDATTLATVQGPQESIVSNGPLSLTGQTVIKNPRNTTYANGNVTCDTNAHIEGNLVATGTIHLTDHCQIDGNVTAGGTILMDGSPTVGGSVKTAGKITFQSTAHIGGDASAGTTFQSLNGQTAQQLNSSGAINGTIQSNANVTAPTPHAVTAFALTGADWAGYQTSTWTQWMNATAQANMAPSWSHGLTAKPGCTMSTNADSVNGNTVNITTNSLIDTTQSGCSSIILQGMILKLTADLTIVAKGFQGTSGLTVTSADGNAHTLRILVPGTTQSCTSSQAIVLNPGTNIDSRIATHLHSPGKVTIDGTSSLTGQVDAGCFTTSGATTLTAANVPTPGMN